MLDDPVQNILGRLDHAKPSGDGKWEARCPAHQDVHASLSISRGEDGRVLLHCHAGCSTIAVCQAMGLRLGDLFPPKPDKNGQIVATYDYRDAGGDLLFQVVRFAPKQFRQRRPDGKGGWTWKLDGVPKVLYRLPELRAADPTAIVVIAEGEKDVDNLVKLGFVATCNPGGAEKWRLLHDDSALVGRDVVIIPDKDSTGRRHAQDVARRLHNRASSVRILELPGDDKDASDWIAAGGTAEQLSALIASAPIYTAPAETPTALPSTLPLSGEPPPGSIDPATGRLILSTKRTLPTAEAFVREFHTHDEGRTLQHYAGMLMGWCDNRYVQVEDDAFRSHLLPWMHAAVHMNFDSDANEWAAEDFPANPTTVRAALESVKAYTHLPAITPSPSWLDDPTDRPDARDIVACRSSLLHLPTMRHLTPTPAFFAVNALDYDPDPRAKVPEAWLTFLGQIFSEDYQAWDLLQDWFGYCLTGDTSQHKMLLLVGPKRSGKGTIARVLTHLIGSGNVAGPTTSSLAGAFGLQPLIGKSLAIVSDARFSGESMQTVVERLLCISGEDTLTIDRKHQTSVTMKLPTRFVFLTNELPRLTDASGALSARFMMIRLTESFYGREDKQLTQRLLAQLPGILNWAIEGWKRLRERGHFVQPASVEDALRDMEDLSSPVGAFVRERCILSPGQRAWVDELYNAWKAWCEQEGRSSVTTKQTFGRDLLAAAPSVSCRRNHVSGRFYDGIGLADGGVP